MHNIMLDNPAPTYAPDQHRPWCDPAQCFTAPDFGEGITAHMHAVVLLDEDGLRVSAYEHLLVDAAGAVLEAIRGVDHPSAALTPLQAGRVGTALVQASVILAGGTR